MLYLYMPSTAVLAQTEHIPSTTAGHAIGPIVYDYAPGSNVTGQWTSRVQFSRASGFVLQDGSHYSNLIIEDMGSFTAPPASQEQ